MSGVTERPWRPGGMVCRESVRVPWRLDPEVDALEDLISDGLFRFRACPSTVGPFSCARPAGHEGGHHTEMTPDGALASWELAAAPGVSAGMQAALRPVNMVKVDARREREREKNRALTEVFLVLSATDRAFRPLAPPLADCFELRTVVLPEPEDA